MEFKGTKNWERIGHNISIKHSNGDWEEVNEIIDEDKNTVCYVSFENQTLEQANAHINIIKASQELLEACIMTAEALYEGKHDLKSVYEKANSAIKKALGQ